MLCRWLGSVKDWGAIAIGEGMLDKGDPEPIDEGGAGGQHIVLHKQWVQEEPGSMERHACTIHEEWKVSGRKGHDAAAP